MNIRMLLLSLFICMNVFANDQEGVQSKKFSFGEPKERPSFFHSKKTEAAQKEVLQSVSFELQSANPRYASLSADFLYWEYTFTDNCVGLETPQINSTSAVSDVRRLDNKWMPGGRFNFTISNIYDWNIGATATGLRGHESTTVPGEVIGFVGTPTTATATGYNSLTYATCDLEFSSKLFLKKSISIQPLFAAEAVYIKRQTNYHFSIDPTGLLSHIIPVKFIGYGPKIGSFLNYKFGDSGCDFFGAGFATLAYGSTKTTLASVNEETDFVTKYIDRVPDLKAGLQIQIGIHYQYYFSDNCAFGLKACWEANYWWNIGNHQQFDTDSYSIVKNTDNIALHGFNVGMNFDF